MAKHKVSTSRTSKLVSKKKTQKQKSSSSSSEAIVISQTWGLSCLWWIFLLGLLVVIFAGLFFGSFTRSVTFLKSFDASKPYIVVEDTTWIPIPGKPIKLYVVTDKTCLFCNPNETINRLQAQISPLIFPEVVDVSTPKGKALVETFRLPGVPQYIFGPNLRTIKDPQGRSLVETLPPKIMEEKDGLYWIKVGNVQKYFTPPSFADVDKEPQKGTGSLLVVEFTDYQCPYCNRLDKNIRKVVDALVAEGKIRYLIKDFPLSFHPEALPAHQAANCIWQQDKKAYWDFHNRLFDEQKAWSGKGVSQATSLFISWAKDLGTDIEACMKDESILQEIQGDQEEGMRYGVGGTPHLFIGTQSVSGAIDANTFQKLVEEELKAQQTSQ